MFWLNWVEKFLPEKEMSFFVWEIETPEAETSETLYLSTF